jgi:hypothetical protein
MSKNQQKQKTKSAPKKRTRTRKDRQVGWSLIEKDELIQAVDGSVSLAATQFAINPGLPNTFPIGAPEAKRWTEWRAEMVEFYFLSTVSGYASQGQKGRVVLACDYSALNDAPTSLQAAEALHAALGKPADKRIGLMLDVSILNKADPKYIRSGPVPPNSDVRLFDGGNLWFVTSGMAGTDEIGELRVRYRFRVRLPNLDDTPTLSSRTVAIFNLGTTQTLTTNTQTTVLFDEEVVNGPGITNNSGVFTLPAGVYLVRAEMQCTDSASEAFHMALYGWVDGAVTVPPSSSGAATTTSSYGPFVGLTWYAVSDGTTTVALRALFIGASGTLGIGADFARLIFQQV